MPFRLSGSSRPRLVSPILTEMETQNGLAGYDLKLKLARVYCGGIAIRYERAIPNKGKDSAV